MLATSGGLLAAWLAGRGGDSPGPGIVLFASRRDVLPREGGGGAGLYAVNADGSGLRRVTARGEHLWGGLYGASFSPSPDGREVAYASAEGWIWIVRLDGQRRRRVTRGEGVAWSPTGAHLAVLDGGSLSVVEASGAGRRRLAQEGVYTTPSWSPDGKRLAYIQSVDESDLGALRIAPLQGIQEQLPVIADTYQSPHWSPDGDLIAFGAFDPRTDSVGQLTVIRPDGSQPRLLARDARLGVQPWSPDGKQLIFALLSRPESLIGDDIYVIGADGRGRRRVVENPPPSNLTIAEVDAAWSADGSAVAHLRNRFRTGVEADIFVTDLDSRASRRVTDAFPEGGDHSLPVWAAGRLTGGAPRLETFAVSGRRLRVSEEVWDQVAGDADRLYVRLGAFNAQPELRSWSPETGAQERVPIACVYAQHLDAVAGSLLVQCPLRQNLDALLVVRSPSGNTRHIRLPPLGRGWNAPTVGDVRWDGREIVYDRRPAVDPHTIGHSVGMWRLEGRGEVRIPRTDGLAPMDLDRGRIAAVHTRNGDVVVLLLDGTRLRTLAFQPNAVRQAFLTGHRLGVNDRGVLRLIDVRDGRALTSRRLLRGGGPPPELLGLDGDMAVYDAGLALHLVGLPHGPDVVLRTPEIGAGLSATLTSGGLAYAYDAAFSRKPGRVAFVPRRELERALRAARR